LLFGYGLFLWLVAVNLRIDGDESKYYTTIKEVSDSGLSLKNFHQGSAGFYFYKIHTAWAYLFGTGYEVGRALNIALTIGALALMFFGLRRLFNSDFIPFFWLIAFGCNPFFATHSVQISHYAVSTALLLAAVGSMILYATSNRLSGRALVPVVLIAIFLVVAANVRDHLWPAWGISAVFLVLLYKQAGSRAMLRVLGVYLLTSVLIGSIPLMTHSSPLSERDAALASLSEGKKDSSFYGKGQISSVIQFFIDKRSYPRRDSSAIAKSTNKAGRRVRGQRPAYFLSGPAGSGANPF
jgi:hypothetical protein